MTDNDKQFLEFITGTLLPDMEQEGPSGTADDIKRLVRIIRQQAQEIASINAYWRSKACRDSHKN